MVVRRSDYDSHRRDLELLLLGVCITKGDRQRVLDALPPEQMSKEVGALCRSIQNQEPGDLNAWLEERSAHREKGQDLIQSLINAIDTANRREAVANVCRSLEFAAKIESVDELKARLSRALAHLEAL